MFYLSYIHIWSYIVCMYVSTVISDQTLQVLLHALQTLQVPQLWCLEGFFHIFPKESEGSYGGFHKLRYAKWWVYNGNPHWNGWLGGTPISGNQHMMTTGDLPGPPKTGMRLESSSAPWAHLVTSFGAKWSFQLCSGKGQRHQSSRPSEWDMSGRKLLNPCSLVFCSIYLSLSLYIYIYLFIMIWYINDIYIYILYIHIIIW